MEYIVFLVCGICVLYSLYVAIVTIVKYFAGPANKLFLCIVLCTLCIALCILIPYVNFTVNLTFLARCYAALIFLIVQLFFHYIQIFPRWGERLHPLSIVFSVLPGIPLFFYTMLSNGVILESSVVNKHMQFVYGRFIVVYLVIFLFYLLGTFLIIIYKLQHAEHESLKRQLIYFSLGILVSELVMLLTFIIMPYNLNRFEYHSLGISSSVFLLLYINHYAIGNEKNLNFKEFYIKSLFYMFVMICLLVPTYWMLVGSYRYFLLSEQIPSVGVSVIIVIYLFVFTRFLQPYLGKLIRKEYAKLESNFNKFIKELSQTEDYEGDPSYWDRFFAVTIDSLEYLFDVKSAVLMMFDETEESYIVSRIVGEQLKIKRLSQKDSLIQLCRMVKGTIDRSLFYTDELIKPFDDVLQFLQKNSIEIVLPCFNQDKLVAILLLGPHKNGRSYTYNEIQFMELYRVKFNNALVNSLQIEEVKSKQIVEHDNLVVNAIKSSILPKQLPFIEHIRLSSFFMNNSNRGGEFFNVKILHKSSLAFLISDCSYSGVDAAVLALELYAAFESLSPAYDTPEKIMQLLNWVVCTSKFTNRYATSLCFTFNSEELSLKYINAAFNPLIIYEIKNDNFLELDTKGIPIGIERDFIYESKEYKVKGPCIGCIYSNGNASIISSNGRQYSVGRLKDIIRLYKNENPALLIRRISADINTYLQNVTLKEDISIVIFRIE